MNKFQVAVAGFAAMACAAPAFAAGSVTGNFQAQITITNTCALTTAPTNLAFGSTGVLTGAVDAQSTVKVTCTTGAPYNIGLDAGANESSANDVTTRRMTDGASHYVNYSMFTTSGHNSVWGDSIGSNTVSSNGTGSEQSFTVYGRVPAQTTPQAGDYADTVVVTVTY